MDKSKSDKSSGSGDGSKEKISHARRHIQNQIEAAEAEQRRQMLVKRIELANAGVRAYQLRKMGDAVKSFHTYLGILEDWKGVPEGGLSPSHFDREKDVAELLLISGVYWDLAKLYDRTQTPERQREFRHYLEKYVLFSKGMPFQTLCSETMRKYISNEKPVHRDAFKSAYRVIATSRCFVATSLVDELAPSTIPRLRAIRDLRLRRGRAGRAFIAWYYRRGRRLAEWVDRQPRLVRKSLALALDAFAALGTRDGE